MKLLGIGSDGIGGLNQGLLTAAIFALESKRDEIVGEVRIFGQKRAVEIGTESIMIDGPFSVVFSIIAVAFEDTTERFGCTQVGATTVIFEANQSAIIPTESDIADTTWDVRAFMNGPGIEDAEAAHIGSFCGSIVVCEKLEAAANSQDGHIVFDGRPQANALNFVEILCDRSLLFVLSAADEEEIVLVGSECIANAQPDHVQVDAAQLTAAAQG
jgi:hypothetical protein